jgi:hypothetical protein
MALTQRHSAQYDPSVNHGTPYDPSIDIPGKVSTTFYEGGAVTDDGGNGEADMLTASEGFIGFVEKGVVTNATTSDINVKIRTQGIIKDLPVTGLTPTPTTASPSTPATTARSP